jgi:hypothetical protein
VNGKTILGVVVVLLSMLGLVALTAAPGFAQDELVLTVSVDQATLNPRTGLATVTGTVTCSEPAIIRIGGTLTQTAGSEFTGYSFTRLTCPGPEGTAFSLLSLASVGQFRPGPAHLHLFVEGCVLVSGVCAKQAILQTDTTIRLEPAQ